MIIFSPKFSFDKRRGLVYKDRTIGCTSGVRLIQKGVRLSTTNHYWFKISDKPFRGSFDIQLCGIYMPTMYVNKNAEYCWDMIKELWGQFKLEYGKVYFARMYWEEKSYG